MPLLFGFGKLKAIGAYFDFNFDATGDPSCSSSTFGVQPPLFDAKFHPSPNSIFNQTSPLIWCVQNSGSASWPEGTYLTTQPDLTTIPVCDKSVVWLPLPSGYRKPVSELSPGSYAHIVVDVQPPPQHICTRVLSTNTPVLGALKLCLPSGDRFGELLYCSAIPQLTTGSIFLRAGTPIAPILPPEPQSVREESSSQQPMDEDT
ncbi:hypothetical protein TcWFU_005343 [Taenia crassiceps]|uniref:Next to BRCA1 central domain-containing protein n=1 Tax=Taenia crassiceps TaxID=6207 RepID=A0ABR4QRG8_9CEST